MNVQKTNGPNGYDLAYMQVDGDAPTVIFLGGYRSDMEGTKALHLEALAQEKGFGFLRFDYGGHGISGGVFKDGTISSWAEDTLHMIDHHTKGDVILVGSSMGGWIALLCALKRPDRIKALVGIAAAPDFTGWIEDRLTGQNKKDLEEQGYFEEPNDYSDEPYMFTKALLEDGRANSLLEGDIAIDIPVRLLQGMKDEDVPWQTAHRIKNAITGGDVEVLLSESGDHRFSREEDLKILTETVLDLTGRI